MRSFSRKVLAAGALGAAGALAVGAGLAGADSQSTGAGSSDVQLVQTDPSTTVPDQNPDDGGRDESGRHCDHDGGGGGSSDDGSSANDSGTSASQASFRRGSPSSLRWG